MANYDFRYNLVVGHLGNILNADADQKQLVDLMKKAGATRQHYTELCDGLIVLIKAAPDHTKESFHDNWDELIDRARAKLKATFDEEPRIQSLPSPLKEYWGRAYLIEDQVLESFQLFSWRFNFFNMIIFEKEMQKIVAELTAKWRAILSQIEGPVSTQKTAVGIMIKAIESSISEVEGYRAHVDRMLGEVKSKMDQIEKDQPSGSDFLIAKKNAAIAALVAAGTAAIHFSSGAISAILTSMGVNYVNRTLAKAQENRATFVAALQDYRAKLVQQGGVLGMFKSNRDIVSKYCEDQNLDKMTQFEKLSTSILEKWVADSGTIIIATPEISANAKLVAAEIDVLQKAMLARCKAVDLAFQTDFLGLFVGPLKPETIETLVNEFALKTLVDAGVYGLDVRQLDQVPLLQGVIDEAVHDMAESLAEPQDMTDEYRVIWLAQKQQFVEYLNGYLRDFKQNYLDAFIKEAATTKETVLQLAEKVDRSELKGQIT